MQKCNVMNTPKLMLLIALAVVMMACTPSEQAPRPTLQIFVSTVDPDPSMTPEPTITQTPLLAETNTPPPSATTIPPTQTPLPTATLDVTSPNGQVKPDASGLRLRSLPSEFADIQVNLNANAPLVIYGRTEASDWLAVRTDNGRTGWVMTQFVDSELDLNRLAIINVDAAQLASLEEQAAANIANDEVAALSGSQGLVVAEGNGLRLRELPSTNSTILGQLPENSGVTVLGRDQSGEWLQVNTDLGQGWVYGTYIQSNVDVNTLAIPEAAFIPTPEAFVPPTNDAAFGTISGVTSNASQIFIRGQSMGNRANVFSKVGDSITETGPYLMPFGEGNYNLRNYAYFQEVVNYYLGSVARQTNSFANDSLAAKGGWTTRDVLNPALAEQPPCNAGETPLVCEYRTVRPAVAIIMLGTNDLGLETSEYSANLQQIVQITIDMGIVPILSTIPPRDGLDAKVNTYNGIVTSTARSFDIPLMDYYSAMVQLPNRGLSSDGVHPSWVGESIHAYYPSGDLTEENLLKGYPLRNLMTLQALDTVWRQVLAPNASSSIPVTNSNTDFLQNTTSSSSDGDTASTCAGAPAPRLTIGGQGRVTPGLPNNIRAAADLDSTKLGEIPADATFQVLDGPVCADGLLFWQVNYNSVTGWTAEGRGIEYWVDPVG